VTADPADEPIPDYRDYDPMCRTRENPTDEVDPLLVDPRAMIDDILDDPLDDTTFCAHGVLWHLYCHDCDPESYDPVGDPRREYADSVGMRLFD
jgi:hypothetical protein